MTQYFARVVSGVVAEIITLPDGVAVADAFHANIVATLELATAAITVGQTFANGAFGPALPPPPPGVPNSVTDLQFRLALNQAGLREQAEAYIASASQDVKDWWDRATRIERADVMLNAAVKAIGKTDADRDALFTLAASL